jgi:membrane protein DedA with SNARE-associated domain
MEHLQQLISVYGYWAVAGSAAAESIGVPLPAETLLVLAALYAGAHHDVSISGVIASAAAGAILGDNVGYWVGSKFGYRLLVRYGPMLGLSHSRIKLGMYLFQRHGGKVVFFGRFIALFRALAACLAGVNQMPWRKFLIANAAGGIVWASCFGLGAYLFGKALLELTHLLAAALLVIGAMLVMAAMFFVHTHEAELQAQAERAFPGPLPLVPGAHGRSCVRSERTQL